MDVVFYAKKKYVRILNHVLYLAILGHMFNVKKKLKYFVIVIKNRKLFPALLKVRKIFVAMKFVESN
jgi:hypothetical protein